MTFDQLEYFLKAAKYRNLSKAANELFISHSALSKSMSALEDELDAVLFIRDKNSLHLTAAARRKKHCKLGRPAKRMCDFPSESRHNQYGHVFARKA
ncbi:MAG: LysR family transcriptional regulator [Eubacterium sp.]|nr:LysR family transcriptional regulator [Eubacterium sp.]